MLLKVIKSYRLLNALIALLNLAVVNQFLLTTLKTPSFLYDKILDFLVLGLLVIGLHFFGNLHNDYYDQQSDHVNGKNNVFLVYGNRINKILIALTLIITVAASVFLLFESPLFFYYGISTIVLLIIYNKYIQHIPLLGNIVVALITASISFLPAVFFLDQINFYICLIIVFWSSLAFLINLKREILKDQIDLEGDWVANTKTLPMQLSSEKLSTILIGFQSTTALLLIIATLPSLLFSKFLFLMILFALIAFEFVGINLIIQKQWTRLSKFYKTQMLIGILGLIFL